MLQTMKFGAMQSYPSFTCCDDVVESVRVDSSREGLSMTHNDIILEINIPRMFDLQQSQMLCANSQQVTSWVQVKRCTQVEGTKTIKCMQVVYKIQTKSSLFCQWKYADRGTSVCTWSQWHTFHWSVYFVNTWYHSMDATEVQNVPYLYEHVNASNVIHCILKQIRHKKCMHNKS